MSVESLELLGPMTVAPGSPLPNVKKLMLSSGDGLSDLEIPSSVKNLTIRCFAGSDLVCGHALPEGTTDVELLALMSGSRLDLSGLQALPTSVGKVKVDYSGMGNERVTFLDLSGLPSSIVSLELTGVRVAEKPPKIVGETRRFERLSLGLVSTEPLHSINELPEGLTELTVKGPRPADFSNVPTTVVSLRWQDRVLNDQVPRINDVPIFVEEIGISLHIGEHQSRRPSFVGLSERISALTLEGQMPKSFLGLPKRLETLDLAPIPYDKIPGFGTLPRGIRRLVISVGYARSKPVYESLNGLPDGLEELELYGRLMPDLTGLPLTVRSLLIGSSP